MIGFFKKRALKKRINQLHVAIQDNILAIESTLKEIVLLLDEDFDDTKLRVVAVAGVLHACTEMRALYDNDETVGKSFFFACMRFAPIEHTDLVIDLADELNNIKPVINSDFWPSYSDKASYPEYPATIYMTLIDMAPTVGSNIIAHY